ncbi:SAP30-binding protein [Fagus crenata]
MASNKKQPEGIALLSMYNDEEDEDMEDLEDDAEEDGEYEKSAERRELEGEEQYEDYRDSRMAEGDDLMEIGDRVIGGDSANDGTPPIVNVDSTPDKGRFGNSTPQQFAAVSPQQEAVTALESSRRSRRGMLTIVDYGHDEGAMSPEDGEIEGSGRVMFGEELQTANGHFQDQTSSGTAQALTPSHQVTSPPSFDTSQSDAMNCMRELEGAQVEEAVMEEGKEVDPLDKFLPPPPKAKCSEELQRKINKFLDYKKGGKSFNAEVRHRKDYRNPDFLLHAVTYQDIDQIGSCFSKDVFDPHGYDKSDYYVEIEVDMRREEQEKKKTQKVDFVSGGMQPVTAVSAPKVNMPLPGVASAAGLLPVPPAADTTTRDGRQNKKSKWDKVDGDRRNHLSSGGQDSISTVGAHAVLLSAANAGAGYMAFAQQRRREAEEKRSIERKVDRRS